MESIERLLQIAIIKKASDLHILTEYPPIYRINGQLQSLEGARSLDSRDCERLIFSILTSVQKETLLINRELDFSLSSGNARFRINIYNQKGTLAAAFRIIPSYIRTIEELNLPKICHAFSTLTQGFILVTGPTGHGKSTTIASIIDEINKNRSCHVVTIEDPIEYIYPKRQALISQREMHLDTYSFQMALRSVLREDANVILVGEMRDYETMASALTVAETGHLVFATLHTNSAAQTIDRIVDVFPPFQQMQIKMQLSLTLEGIICQRLIPSLDKDIVPACEVLLATPAVRNSIREGKTHQIDNIITTSGDIGMMTLEVSLAQLVREGKISLDTAKVYALRPGDLIRRLE